MEYSSLLCCEHSRSSFWSLGVKNYNNYNNCPIENSQTDSFLIFKELWNNSFEHPLDNLYHPNSLLCNSFCLWQTRFNNNLIALKFIYNILWSLSDYQSHVKNLTGNISLFGQQIVYIHYIHRKERVCVPVVHKWHSMTTKKTCTVNCNKKHFRNSQSEFIPCKMNYERKSMK